ncbi:MAG: AAA family ATPase, partial [Nitrososphaerota archaeon]
MTRDKNSREAQLRVAEARQRDIGRKIARVDSRAMRDLGLSPGDIIEVVGKKSTVAIVWPPYKEDDGMGLIRIDGEIRKNAGVSVGDYVVIRKARAEPAKKIVLAPFENLPFVGDLSRIVRSQLLNLPVMRGDVIVIPVLGMGIELKVVTTSPSNVVIVTENTVIEVSSTPVKRVEEIGGITYEDIGGLHEELQRIREMVELPLKHPELFRHLGIEPPKGVILWGPPGCGKTLIAKAIANETGAHFISINGPEVM